VRTEIVFANNLDSNCPPFHTLFNYKRKPLQPTSTTIFDKPHHSNVEVNNVSNFTAYYVCLHAVLLVSKDFYRSSTLHKKIEKRQFQEFADIKSLVKILFNKNWEIGTFNTTNICENNIYIIAAGFRHNISSCDCVNK
jgi:hypothetical protein